MEKNAVSNATISRMPGYLRYLRDAKLAGKGYVSSSLIAKDMAISAVLVRKDLSIVSSVPGKPRYGFEVGGLIRDIEKFLGYDNLSSAVVVGAGGLGKAFLGYEGFQNYGLNIIAAFDIRVTDETVRGKPVYPMEKFDSFVKEHKVKLGIITVPKASAQLVCDKLVGAGIRGIWNFANTQISVPDTVVVKNVDLAASLALLSGDLANLLQQEK
ncbi:MAG: redox-sensing transcriptional repressor Rex [Clostridia bacterium]|nr:redox-sensing transcriptional repressor Rex [Clostridia bacterium]